MQPKPDKFVPALYGGIIMALISSIPFVNLINCFCCAGVLLGGFLAVFFYKNNFMPDSPPLNAGDCMVVGLFAGCIGALLGSMLSILFVAAFGNVMGDFILRMFHQMNLNLPDQSWKTLEDAAEKPMGAVNIVIQLFTNLVVYDIFGLLGGLIGYSIYKPKHLVMMPPPPPATSQS